MSCQGYSAIAKFNKILCNNSAFFLCVDVKNNSLRRIELTLVLTKTYRRLYLVSLVDIKLCY